MKSPLIRTIAGWLVLCVLVIPGIALPAMYVARHIGTTYIRDMTAVARTQAVELLLVLVSQSEGDRSPEKMVQLSSTMAALEERTMHQTQGIVAIREIALIDTKGRVLAHNDVTKMARDTPSRFHEEKYTRIGQRIRRDSIQILPLETFSPQLPSNKAAQKAGELLLPALQKSFPDLFVSSYEATAAVYPVDGEVPSGGIVMVVENRAPLRIFGLMGSLLSPAAFVAAAILLVLLLYLPVLLLLAGRRKSAQVSSAQDESIPSVEAMPGSMPGNLDADVDPDFHVPEMPAVDFGEVPLPDFIQAAANEHSAVSAYSHSSYSHSASGSGALLRPALDEILDAIPVEPD